VDDRDRRLGRVARLPPPRAPGPAGVPAIVALHHLAAHPEISIAAGFSGHGYKFCSVIGEVMADLVQEGRSRHDTGFFRLGRFGGWR
jgi:glycine/D-amino acid oxidase-like deaminating enzyme